eukprot:Gregarina_sp_Pseudo_9__342@NODE_121_length_4132_cov_33_412900_g113_i0_p3_GENE_NODE_121_length_4132_cov_33_412900_g113_i0NODE_121_length_4132_cov_33_412900_g113_i0_p3_ORF_typecomplete_len248_score24_58_NODE_121_length_4132_cov_33_412900_g113_i023223065
MPDVTNVWTAIHTFPAADGSRTLRVTVAPEIIDSLYSTEAVGFRHTCFRSQDRRIMSKSEVRDYGSNVWLNSKEWLEVWQKRFNLRRQRMPKLLPAVVCHELQKGSVRSVQQVHFKEAKSVEGLKSTVELETSEGQVTLEEWLRREAAHVEMCLPLSKDEAHAFLDQAVIMGVRHSFVVDPLTGESKHTVEVSPTGENWDMLPPWTAVPQDSIVEPHFRITYQNKLNYNRSRIVSHSQTPWLSSEKL